LTTDANSSAEANVRMTPRIIVHISTLSACSAARDAVVRDPSSQCTMRVRWLIAGEIARSRFFFHQARALMLSRKEIKYFITRHTTQHTLVRTSALSCRICAAGASSDTTNLDLESKNETDLLYFWADRRLSVDPQATPGETEKKNGNLHAISSNSRLTVSTHMHFFFVFCFVVCCFLFPCLFVM
jgi:hypothetical protein